MTTTQEESTWQPAYPEQERGNGNGNGNASAPAGEGPNAGARTPARVGARASGPDFARAVADRWRSSREARREHYDSLDPEEETPAPEYDLPGGFWTEGPASMVDVVAYHRGAVADSWGNGRRWEGALDFVFGYLLSIPLTTVLHGLEWVVQKKHRTGIVLAVIAFALFAQWIGQVISAASGAVG
jgi:hypothetical protein